MSALDTRDNSMFPPRSTVKQFERVRSYERGSEWKISDCNIFLLLLKNTGQQLTMNRFCPNKMYPGSNTKVCRSRQYPL